MSKKYDDMYFTNYHKALLHAAIGRMNFYVAVVAEAEGLGITGIKQNQRIKALQSQTMRRQ